ncbi:MAG: hypothetical protein OXI63_26060 [Candidatus Poribacteria bacterium]|nr:hypothetical protein [Candidatus Poribacteria bacterium]
MAWTEDNNKQTINQLLDYYADLLSRYADFVEQLGTADLPTKLKSLQTLKSVALTIDALLRRWSFANRGYDSNTHQARQAAAELSTQKSTPENDTEDVSYTDDDMVELKIRLRALPESEDEPFITGETLEETDAPSPEPLKVKKSMVAAAISNFLEAGEQSTAAIARKTGRSERTVRRDLTEMLSAGKVSLVKKGVYKLHRSVKWTELDNREIINELLRVYTEMIDVCKGGVKDGFTLEDVSDTEQLKSVKTFNACVATVDRLMKRWSLVHLGWNTNPQLAKADAEAEAFAAARVDLQDAPIEAFFEVTTHYHSDMKAIVFSMPRARKNTPPNYEVGLWAYDGTAQELYPPNSTKPISESAARKILLNRKTTDPAPLIVFGRAW